MSALIDLSTITWGLVLFMLLLIVYFHGPGFSLQTVRNAPSILTSFGIFGTFLGIAFGLMGFDSANIEASVPVMIDGLGVAVWSSIVGILGALSIRLRHAVHSIQVDSNGSQKQASVTDLNNAIAALNTNLNQLRSESRADAEALLESSRSYQGQMVEANTQALTTALATVMTEFNSRIEVQYGENFQKFNESLGQLLQWQQSYSSQLSEMLQAQQASTDVIKLASKSYEQMISHSQEFNRVAASLGELLKGLEQQTSNLEGYLSGLSSLVGQASEDLPALGDYVSQLTLKLSSSIEQNNESLTQVLSKAARDISDTVEQVTHSLADSVNQAHGGLAEHVQEMTNKTDQQMRLLDEAMEKELTQALQTFGYQLTALSEKFVNDYIPLTDRLRELLTIAEMKPDKRSQTVK
jgi:DNA anti-recombination protein RmuC